MEKFTSDIESMLDKKLSLYKKLNEILKQERESIVQIDVDSLWKSADKKKIITREIHQIREDILSRIDLEFNISGMDVSSFSVSYLIRTLPVPNEFKAGFRKIKLAIEEQKAQLAQAATDNKKYVSEYLSVIDDIMSAVVDHSKQSRYNHAGNIPDTKTSKCLIHAEV